MTLLVIAIVLVVSVSVTQVNSQSSDIVALSYQAYSEIATIYRSGGQAPDLVAKLNTALDMLHSAQLKHDEGDEQGATMLENQARTILDQVIAEVPPAQQQAKQEVVSETLSLMLTIPVTAIASTLVFYVALSTFRWYEKMKLYELRIVEKETED
jgi:hypothetical protein